MYLVLFLLISIATFTLVTLWLMVLQDATATVLRGAEAGAVCRVVELYGVAIASDTATAPDLVISWRDYDMEVDVVVEPAPWKRRSSATQYAGADQADQSTSLELRLATLLSDSLDDASGAIEVLECFADP